MRVDYKAKKACPKFAKFLKDKGLPPPFKKNGDGNYADNPLRNDVSLGGSENEEDLNSYEGVIPGINAAREKFKNGDLIFDARIAYNLNTLIRIGLVVNNVFNTEYMTRPATMMPPRTFALQCNLKI